MRIDIVHGRDPDSSCELTVYVDGKPVEFKEWSFDPGAGMEVSEYDSWRDEAIANAPQFLKPMLAQLFDDYRETYERWGY